MKSLFATVALAGSLSAQPYYPRHNITFGVGSADPQAQLEGLFRQRPGISIAYGYRFQRYFQADAGFDTVFGAGNIRNYLNTPFGPSRIRDYQFFVPFGGRAILPLWEDRILFFGGGGPAYIRYSELVRQPSDFYRIDCPECATRSGWAYYSTVGLEFFVDRGRHFRLGAAAKQYRGHTEGDELGPVPGIRTRDRWLDIFGQVGFSF
jgi:hypothetical protein